MEKRLIKKLIFIATFLFSAIALAQFHGPTLPHSAPVGAPIDFSDDVSLEFGTGAPAQCLWETADANANELICFAPEGGSTDVPVFLWGDATINNRDMGLFNGVTDPSIAVASDDGTKAGRLFHNGTNLVLDSTSGAVSMPDGITTTTVTASGSVNFTSATNIGWSVQAATNQACNTTCTSACVFGYDVALGGADLVDCADTTADRCLCAGAN